MNNKLRIALIADMATALGLSPDADLVHLSPQNWWLKINLFKPDFLLVESAWRGENNRWQGKIVDTPSVQLIQLVEYCSKRDIPAIFWNKEDPIHFDRFKQTAVLFDYVLTTDSDSIPRYKQLQGQHFKIIETMQFCAQPKLQFPNKQNQFKKGLAFLGGFYGEEFPYRSQQQSEILTALRHQQLQIFDRFWFEHKNDSSFPSALKNYCHPSVGLQKAYELYRDYEIHLNFNTVQASPSMLSRRVFELAASKALIISTPSKAMDLIYGNSIPQITNGISAKRVLDLYLNHRIHRLKDATTAYEITLDSHTWQHRLSQITKLIGLQ